MKRIVSLILSISLTCTLFAGCHRAPERVYTEWKKTSESVYQTSGMDAVVTESSYPTPTWQDVTDFSDFCIRAHVEEIGESRKNAYDEIVTDVYLKIDEYLMGEPVKGDIVTLDRPCGQVGNEYRLLENWMADLAVGDEVVLFGKIKAVDGVEVPRFILPYHDVLFLKTEDGKYLSSTQEEAFCPNPLTLSELRAKCGK